LGRLDLKGGIPAPLRLSTSSHDVPLFRGDISRRGKETGSAFGSASDEGQRSHRGRSGSFPRLLQQNFSGAKVLGGMETHYRPLDTEHSHKVPTLQDGDRGFHSQGSQTRAVAHQPGSERRLLSYPYPSVLQTLPQVLSRRRRLAIQSSPLRAQYGSSRIYEGHGCGSRLRSRSRDQSPRLSRRLVTESRVGGIVKSTDSLYGKSVQSARMGNKREEVRSDTFSGSHVPGYYVRYQDRPSLSGFGSYKPLVIHSEGIHSQTGSACSAMEAHFGASSFSRETSSVRQDSYPPCSATAPFKLVSEDRFTPPPRSPQSGGCSRNLLVEGRVSSPSRDENRHCPHQCLPVHRQQLCRVGCSHGRPDLLGCMAPLFKGCAYKRARAAGRLARPSGLPRYDPGLQCRNYVRQCHCHCLSEESGGHTVTAHVSVSQPSLHVGRVSVHNIDTQTSPWASKCSCRSAEQEGPSPKGRMESKPSRSEACVQTLGQPPSGSVRSQAKLQISNLHVSDLRTGGMEGGQSSPILDRSVRLRVSPNVSNQANSEQACPRQGRVNPDSTVVAQTGVVPGTSQAVNRLSVGAPSNTQVVETDFHQPVSPEARIPESSRVEIISGFNRARGFSEQVSNRIAVPQRRSTALLYESKWKLFREWCLSKGVDPNTPSVPIIADFLLHLFNEGKATITIKGYRSALSTLMASRGLDISHNPDLNNLIRSFSVERPRTLRETPRWDLAVVLRYLMRPPFEPMNVCTLPNLTRKTAFLLTLASAKRNSEVWAFSADVAFGPDKSSATLRFLPDFIAKTQKVDKPETALNPVTIPALAPSMGPDLPDRSLCPVRALLYYTNRTGCSKPGRHRRLFVSIKPGHHGDILKPTISGWIKGLIRSAYSDIRDEDTPHLTHINCQARELRAMATSLAFHQHHSVKQVMDAASWRVDSTFAAFYLRDLTPSHLMLGPVVAGQTIVSGP